MALAETIQLLTVEVFPTARLVTTLSAIGFPVGLLFDERVFGFI